MDFLKTVGGKIVGGLVLLAVVAAGIGLWRMDSSTRGAMVRGAGNILAWTAIVAIWPWVSFAIIRWVSHFQSNLAGGLLVFAYTAMELGLLLWLFPAPHGTTAWAFVAVGVLLSGAYNLFACDWIAEKLE